MKKLTLKKSRTKPVRAVCTVSAAALMLGVSHAATVGFNFQTHYCSSDSYSGAVVTAPAFGIGTTGWESLSQMDTGYGCDFGPFSLSETIDTTTSSDGLNPLPKGSLTVNWSGYVANVSGFGGYDRSPPHYTFGGNGHHPGEEEVYWGFIRDGVNFGPGSSGGDNDQPGYSVDIVGLKSVFTNSFVVELIASSDSLSGLTNAFIIDAAISSTQSVTYPNIAPIAIVGDTPWPRGIGGGLSTSSGPVDTDHLQIIGNRAGHSEGPPSFNNASTISGFIITDKPVVTMSPQPVLAFQGDNITLRAIAIGVPPLAVQWRKDGATLAGATNLTFAVTNADLAAGGLYDLVVTNLYGSTTSKVSTVTIDHLAINPQPLELDSKPTGPASDGSVLGATWLATSADAAGTNRSGVMQFTAATPGEIFLSSSTNFDSPQGAITFWIRSAGVLTNQGNEGAMLVDHRAGSGLVVVQHDDGTIFVQTAPASANAFSSSASVSDDKWHQVAINYDQSDSGSIEIYIDGVLDMANPNNAAWSWTAGQEIELGLSHDSYWRPYNGLLDDFRLYNRNLTGSEVSSVFASDALVDSNALEVRLNFDTAPASGVTVTWQSPTAVLQSSALITGDYVDVPSVVSPYTARAQSAATFYRYRDTHTAGNVLSNPYDM